ncbi:MAG TPA: DedA family protein [Thermomicrobiales bacterium]|nr:DedA family protein [Thermomicrobiales bacterium]
MAHLPRFGHGILAFVIAHQYGGLFLLLVIEEAGVPLPLPGDTLIMYAGIRSRMGHNNAALTLAVVTAAATIGSSVLYWLARRGGRAALRRCGRFLHLHPARVGRMEARYRRWGPWAIILGRLIPGLRTPTSAMAGLFEVPYRLFAPCTACSALLWAAFYFYFGALLAPEWRRALAFALGDLDESVGIAAILGAALAAAILALRWRRQRAASSRRPLYAPAVEPPADRAGSPDRGGRRPDSPPARHNG